jgi:hypothetical protein
MSRIKELSSANSQLTSQQIKEAKTAAKNALDEAAELRGRIAARTPTAQ